MDELSFPKELEPFDHLMLRNEHDPRGRSGFLAVSVLEEAPELDGLRAVYERASRVVVRLRQKVVIPSLPLGPPEWVVDPSFDLEHHVHQVELPSPGRLRDLLDLAQPILAAPFDLDRPLWELHVVTGLTEAGEAALLLKAHHAVMDGMAAVGLFTQIFDFSPDGGAGRPAVPSPPPEHTSPADLTRAALKRLPGSSATSAAKLAAGAVGAARHLFSSPVRSVGEAAGVVRSVSRLAGGPACAPSPLLRERSTDRRFELVDFAVDDLRAAAKAAGGSLNDAYLSGVCGLLRRYHEALGSPVDALPLALPISTRQEGDPAAGNRFSAATLPAPVGEVDPGVRMRRIGEMVRAARAEPALTAVDAFMPVAVRLPTPVLGAMARYLAHIDVQASNVPGYPEPVWVDGIRVVRTFGFGPVPGVAAMFTMTTMAGRAEVTANYDTAAFTDAQLFGRCLREGFDEVLGSAGSV